MADEAHEIIIVRRRGDDEDGHHSAAWKIALADFMTAMMSLFLVLWLVNSTSKETKSAIADYFNPIRLAEMSPEKKGLRDPTNAPSDSGEPGKTGESKGGEGKGKDSSTSGSASRAKEAALFQDPYAVLAKLAAEADAERPGDASSADAVTVQEGKPGVTGGEAARDPFDPLYWQVAPLPQARSETPGPINTVAKTPSRVDARAALPNAAREGRTGLDLVPKEIADLLKPPGAKPERTEAKPAEAKPAEAKPAEAKPAEAKPAEAKPAEVKPAEVKPAAVAPVDAKAAEPGENAALAELKAEVLKAVQPLATGAPAPKVEVRRTGEGTLISITDELNFSMFNVGSAEPQAKVVKALERIAKVLSSRPGQIVLRGHTDARPFKSESYDNWRLSSARAQMAAYMLIRGGVAERRIVRIEGHADRQPRNPSDPMAAENRRIEILLREKPE
ncbi:MotB family protein [Methylobacterium sp. WSM2598]|uniref:MotB family protein n=1 Tax=Methylobacterium sp. WSM2598 TaxID=398261 RepID=UPI000369161E|nr:MotB family protein [Methylobacterium sp. WSM2598]